MKRRMTKQTNVVTADPSQWSEASQRSVSAQWTREYRDIEYSCWHCQARAVFSAVDQKRAYELKKAPIDQKRVLCADCWKRSLVLAAEIGHCEELWAASKSQLQKDGEFLLKWLTLLQERERYVSYRPNTAVKNMLRKFLDKLAEQPVAADRAEPRSG